MREWERGRTQSLPVRQEYSGHLCQVLQKSAELVADSHVVACF